MVFMTERKARYKLMSEPKRVVWNGTCKDELSKFPADVKAKMGHHLYLSQIKQPSSFTKPFTGGHGISESNNKLFQISVRDDTAYRLVFANLPDAIYPLHVFTKSSEATASQEVERISQRYKEAQKLSEQVRLRRPERKREKYDARFRG